jgi:uncharacterized membrane protein
LPPAYCGKTRCIHDFVLILHLFGLVLLAAGVGIANLSGILTGKADTASAIKLWSGINHKVEHILILPGALLLILSGTYLVNKDGYDFSAGWISAAYALWVVAVVIGAGVLGRHSKQLHTRASALVAAGTETDEDLLKLARSPKGPVFGNILNLVLLAFLYLMVVRPGS